MLPCRFVDKLPMHGCRQWGVSPLDPLCRPSWMWAMKMLRPVHTSNSVAATLSNATMSNVASTLLPFLATIAKQRSTLLPKTATMSKQQATKLRWRERCKYLVFFLRRNRGQQTASAVDVVSSVFDLLLSTDWRLGDFDAVFLLVLE